MAKTYALKAEERERAGKGIARSLRRAGKTPAVIYGDKKEPVKITLNENEINVEYNRGQLFTTLCSLDVAGKEHLVLARDVQLHPVTDVVEHVDFLRVTDKTRLAVDVPVQFINEDKCPSLEQKGTLNVVRFTIELTCRATNIPDFIEVNIEGKEHGDAVKVSDATLPDGAVPVISDRDFTIATLVPPKTAEQEEAEEAAAAEAGDGIISDEEAAAAEDGEGEEAEKEE